jgi:CheY-like chemotaxis protein
VKRIVNLVMQLAKDLQAVPQILIVEDDRDDRFLMSRTLDLLGCQVYEATNVTEAHNLLNARISNNPLHPFDVVFLDLQLVGGPNGIEVLRRFHDIAPEVPVIIVTGFPESQMLQDAFSVGYFGLVSKPLEREAVRQIFRKHRIPHEPETEK